MKRGRESKKRRRESAESCIKQRASRTDKQQLGQLDMGNHRAFKERAKLNKRNPQWVKEKSNDS